MAGTTRLELATSAVTELTRTRGLPKYPQDAQDTTNCELSCGLEILEENCPDTTSHALEVHHSQRYCVSLCVSRKASRSRGKEGASLPSCLPMPRQESRLIARSFAIRLEQDHFLQAELWPIWLGLPQLPSGSSSWKNSRNPCSTTLFLEKRVMQSFAFR
jgi:hypothetical protein